MNPGDLTEHLRRGGAATLNQPGVHPVVNEGAMIAPARYAGRGNEGAQFVFEKRYIDGDFRTTVLVDSKGSQSNRAEEGLLSDRREGGAAAKIPTVVVRYPSRELSDLELPHRLFDGHFRAASQDDEAVVKRDWYQAARNATHADLSPLFTTSPASIAFGVWDSTRNRGQLRLRGLFVSELFGVTFDDARDGDDSRNGRGDHRAVSKRSGARIDPMGQDFHLPLDEFEEQLNRQHEHMSPSKVAELEKKLADARKKKEKTISASPLGLGGIPPATEIAFGVSVPEVRRARTYSLAGLRRLRFGGTQDEDVAARSALLAMMLLGAAYADADPDIRAYCDIGAPKGTVLLDDQEVDLDLSIDSCSAFLEEAIAGLPERLAWTGQIQFVDGDPDLDHGATDDAGDED